MAREWYYAEADKTLGPINANEMQIVLSELSDPRSLRVWRVGLKDWERAGNVQELAELIYKPPPLPQITRLRRKPWAKVVYGIGLFIFLMGIGGVAALFVVFTLDDIRT